VINGRSLINQYRQSASEYKRQKKDLGQLKVAFYIKATEFVPAKVLAKAIRVVRPGARPRNDGNYYLDDLILRDIIEKWFATYIPQLRGKIESFYSLLSILDDLPTVPKNVETARSQKAKQVFLEVPTLIEEALRRL
jgi:hypothetical protein